MTVKGEIIRHDKVIDEPDKCSSESSDELSKSVTIEVTEGSNQVKPAILNAFNETSFDMENKSKENIIQTIDNHFK